MPDDDAKREAKFARARLLIREIEQLLIVTAYESRVEGEIVKAKDLHRLAVGLRRGLDNWKGART